MTTKPLPRAVDEIMSLTRSLWDFVYHDGSGQEREDRIFVTRSDFDGWQKRTPAATLENPLWAAIDRLSWMVAGSDEVTFDPRLFRPFVAVPCLLATSQKGMVDVAGWPDLRRKPDRDYFILRNIRAAHGCGQSRDVLRKLRLLTEATREISNKVRGGITLFGPVASLRVRLADSLRNEPPAEAAAFLRFYSEICAALGDPEAQHRSGTLTIAPEAMDLSIVVSRLFGIPTRIPGFDDLFGTGGLNLAQRMDTDAPAALMPPRRLGAAAAGASRESSGPKGRVVLIRGRFGTGKSSLGLTLAAEVARKGGLAWVTLFEQSTEECLIFLESMALLPETGVTVLAIDPAEPPTAKAFEEALAQAPDDGVLVLHHGARDSIQELFTKIAETSQATALFPLRLLVFDPMNAMFDAGGKDDGQVRGSVMKNIESAKATSANIVLVAEDDADTGSPVSFLANLADTVIELSEERQHGYTQRYIEVLKSRFQAESRGRHAMAIRSNRGLSIAPSTSAIDRKLRNRGWSAGRRSTRFGWRELDDKLGDDAILKGDIIVMRGPEGTFKTQMALRFLLGRDPLGPGESEEHFESLFVPLREQMAGPVVITAVDGIVRTEGLQPKDVRVLADLPGGYVQPGRLIQKLEDTFAEAHARGKRFDRVVIANVERWELNCPFVRSDPMFPDVLVDLLHKSGATALIVGGEERVSGDYSLQRSLVGDSNVVIETRRAEFRGTQRVMLRVTRTRTMTHTAEWFDVTFLNDRLYLDLSLERVDARDNVEVVKPKLLLHHDNVHQEQYNKDVVGKGLKATLAANVAVNSANRTTLYEPIQLGPFSSVWELQVIQVDEFQLPVLLGDGNDRPALHRFPATMFKDWLAEDIDPELRAQVYRYPYISAVPYYRNLGVLTIQGAAAVKHGLCAPPGQKAPDLDWAGLAKLADGWSENELFFDYQKGAGEDLNVLFLEIALEQLARDTSGEPASLPDGQTTTFQAWLDKPAVLNALRILRSLCHPAWKKRPDIRCDPRSAVVTRQWFTNLLWSVSDRSTEPFEGIQIVPLPGRVGVSGDWYLAVPDHSAVPLVGLAIIKELTDRTAEIDRARRGLGLPTRSKLYMGQSRISDPHGAFEHVPFLELLKTAARRSAIRNYARLAPELTPRLEEIVALPKDSEGRLEAKIKAVVDRLKDGIEAILDGN